MVAQIDTKYAKTRPSRLWSRLLSYSLFEGRPLTTRGRWINPIIFVLFSIYSKLPNLRSVTAPTFIIGTGRSGTTILGILLSMHKDVGFLNEPKAFWASLRNDEDLIGSYNRNAPRYRLQRSDATPQIRSDALKRLGAYLFISRTKRVVDKYPELIFRVSFVKEIFPDAKFIFLTRNGWDTCNSIENWSSRLAISHRGEIHDWWGVNRRKWIALVDQIVTQHEDLSPFKEQIRCYTDHRAMAAVEWIVTMREGMVLMQNDHHNVFHVPYELLCEQPRKIFEKLRIFMELQPDDIFMDYCEATLDSLERKDEFELPEELRIPFENTMNLLEMLCRNTEQDVDDFEMKNL